MLNTHRRSAMSNWQRRRHQRDVVPQHSNPAIDIHLRTVDDPITASKGGHHVRSHPAFGGRTGKMDARSHAPSKEAADEAPLARRMMAQLEAMGTGGTRPPLQIVVMKETIIRQ